MSPTNPQENPGEDSHESEPAEDRPVSPPQTRNAFTELMSAKPKPPKAKSPSPLPNTVHPALIHNPHNPRTDLVLYINHPASSPPSGVISYTDAFVLVKDAYPKSEIHLLILPRDPTKLLANPRDTLSSDPTFLEAVRAYANYSSALAAKELARRFGQFSATEQARSAFLASHPNSSHPSSPRDYLPDIKIGVHAHPSMTHLHIHVLSRDMHSDCMRHRKHYNSFNTPFFIPLDAFPLSAEDERWSTSHQNANLKSDFTCWRCGKCFGNRFKELKAHLETEFEAWRAE